MCVCVTERERERERETHNVDVKLGDWGVVKFLYVAEFFCCHIRGNFFTRLVLMSFLLRRHAVR